MPFDPNSPFSQPNWGFMFQGLDRYRDLAQPQPVGNQPIPGDQQQQQGNWWQRLWRRQQPNSLAAGLARMMNPAFQTNSETLLGQASGFASDDPYDFRAPRMDSRVPRMAPGRFFGNIGG